MAGTPTFASPGTPAFAADVLSPHALTGQKAEETSTSFGEHLRKADDDDAAFGVEDADDEEDETQQQNDNSEQEGTEEEDSEDHFEEEDRKRNGAVPSTPSGNSSPSGAVGTQEEKEIPRLPSSPSGNEFDFNKGRLSANRQIKVSPHTAIFRLGKAMKDLRLPESKEERVFPYNLSRQGVVMPNNTVIQSNDWFKEHCEKAKHGVYWHKFENGRLKPQSPSFWFTTPDKELARMVKLTGSYRLAWSLQFDPDENSYKPSELWLTTVKAVTISQRGRQIIKDKVATKDPKKELSDPNYIAPGENSAKRRKTSGIDASTLRPIQSHSPHSQFEDEDGASDADDLLRAPTLRAVGEEVEKDGAVDLDDIGDVLESENISGAEPLAKRQKICDDDASDIHTDEAIGGA